MSISIYLPLLISIVGLLVYVLSGRAEVKEIGRLAYACGLLVTLFQLAEHAIKF